LSIGIYFISSFLYRDPWHMFSSLVQYLLLAPSFTNILNVYAFCNLHDVSWGTKGSDKADALPSVSSKKAKDEETAVVDDMHKVQEDIDSAFKETVNRAVAKFDKKEEVEKPTMDVCISPLPCPSVAELPLGPKPYLPYSPRRHVDVEQRHACHPH
jgi:chitin synthase